MQYQQTQEEAGKTNVLQNAGFLTDALPPVPEPLVSNEEAGDETRVAMKSLFPATETSEQALIVSRLRRKLSRRSFLPQMDAYWENPGLLDAEKFGAVLSALHNPAPNSWRERMLCAWLLGHAPLSAEQQTQAARELGKVVRNRHAKRERLRAHVQTSALRTLPCAGLWAAAITVQMMVTSLLNKPISLDASLFLYMCFAVFLALLVPVFVIMFGISGLLMINCSNRVRMAAVLALARLRTPEAVGPLARAVLDVSPNIRSVAEEALRQCLPQITPDHYARLDADTVPALCRLLHVKKERLFANHIHTEQLVLDVLAALGKVGDGSAVRPVQSVAEDGWTQPVRNAAHEILPLLCERQQQENEPRLLLRGSTQPSTPGDQLLRPTVNMPNIFPDQLLRPISTPQTEE